MLHAAVLFSLIQTQCPEPQAWLDGDRSSRDERVDTRERMSKTWEAMGLDLDARKVLDAVVVRESSGDACAIHILGKNEFGRGPGGISVALHLRKWDASSPEEVLHIPEVSAVVMARMLRRSRRFSSVFNGEEVVQSGSWLRFGQVYGGRIRQRDQDPSKDARFCDRLARRDIHCLELISEVGTVLGDTPTDDQETFVAKLQEK